MAKKKNGKVSKASKRRLLIFGTLSCFIIVYFFTCIVTYTVKIAKLQKEQKNLEQELVLLKEEQEELSSELDKLKDPDYLAKYAREKYLYSKQGEYILKLEESQKKIKETSANYSQNVQNGLVAGGILVIAFFTIGAIGKRKKA